MSGDESFYAEFLAPLETRLLRTACRVVRDPDAARDVLQDALLRIWLRRDAVRAHPNPEALIVRIVLHAGVDALRRAHRRPSPGNADLARLPDAKAPSPLVEAERAELREAVLDAIARLPHQQAVAVLMRVVEEEPYPSVARALGCSEITARIHVMRGRARLGRLLADRAAQPAPAGGAS